MGAFELKLEDLGIVDKKAPEKKPESATSYLKNYVDTAKIVKTAINESLGMFGLTTDDVKKKVFEKFQAPQNPQRQITHQQPYRDTTIDEVKTAPVKEKIIEKKMENIDIEKMLKKAKLIVKFLKAEDMKVSEFIKEVEKNKADLEELFS